MTTAVIGAMPNEMRELLAMPGVTHAERRAGMDFHRCELCGRDVVMVQCGIGKVSAAMAAQIMIDRFDARRIVSIGTAGAMPGELPRGGMVVSSDAVESDFDISAIGFEPGYHHMTGLSAYKADGSLIEAAVSACRAALPGTEVVVGRVITADQFTSDPVVVERVRSLFGGLCMEMEGAAIARAAHQNGVPFVLMRLVTNELDESAADDYIKTEGDAAAPLCRAVCELMRK